MPPERIPDTNMWKVPKGEKIVGTNGVIHGPGIVRVLEFQEEKMMQVQGNRKGKEIKIEVPGLNLAESTRKDHFYIFLSSLHRLIFG